MHLSMLYTFVVCASLVHSQAINASESSPDPSGTISTSPKAFNGGKFVPTTSFRSCSNNSSQPPITKQHENSSRSSANIQEVGTTPTASYSIFPRSPPGGVSMNSSDAKSSQKMMAGTSSATVPTSGSIQSAMAAMSTNSAVASGSRTSRTANVRRWTSFPESLAY